MFGGMAWRNMMAFAIPVFTRICPVDSRFCGNDGVEKLGMGAGWRRVSRRFLAARSTSRLRRVSTGLFGYGLSGSWAGFGL